MTIVSPMNTSPLSGFSFMGLQLQIDRHVRLTYLYYVNFVIIWVSFIIIGTTILIIIHRVLHHKVTKSFAAIFFFISIMCNVTSNDS